MTALTRPDLCFHASWAAAVREFEADATTMHGSGLWHLDTTDIGPAVLAREVERLLAEADPATQLTADWVHCSYFWIIEDEEFLGYLAIRHSLNDFLLEQGGHIGYSVRPSRRRVGHAGRALGLALEQSRRLGLDRVLLTCDHDNEPSRRTIVGNGGVYEDRRGGKQRWWIDLSR